MAHEALESRQLRRAIENQTKVLDALNNTLVEIGRELKTQNEAKTQPNNRLYTLCRTCAKARCCRTDRFDTDAARNCACCAVNHYADDI